MSTFNQSTYLLNWKSESLTIDGSYFGITVGINRGQLISTINRNQFYEIVDQMYRLTHVENWSDELFEDLSNKLTKEIIKVPITITECDDHGQRQIIISSSAASITLSLSTIQAEYKRSFVFCLLFRTIPRRK